MAKGHFTQWAAQFAVASELCKRGYEVAFTLGHNTPLADMKNRGQEESGSECDFGRLLPQGIGVRADYCEWGIELRS